MNKFKSLILTTIALYATFAIQAQTLTQIWATDTVLRVPESVLFDEKKQILYVSCIDGKSDEKDGKGSIAKLSLEGKIENLEWVTGLDAPKGMAIFNNMLYVADINRVVIIDMQIGKIANTIELADAKFLNDATVDDAGNVYISDSGAGTIYRVTSENKAEVFFKSDQIKRVNGLLALGKDLYVLDAGTGEHYKLVGGKKLERLTKTSNGADGIVSVSKNEYIASSWGGEVFFVPAKGDAKKMLDTKEQKLNTADIAYNPKTKVLYVPTFYGNTVVAYEFKK